MALARASHGRFNGGEYQPNKPEGVLGEEIDMTKTKMDKVRRLLGNRYTEEGRVAVMQILDNAIKMAEAGDEAILKGVDNSELAIKSTKDLYDRANREPKEVEVEDKSTDEE